MLRINYYCSVKISYVVFFLLFTTFSFGQLTENFSDGNLTSNPEWLGDTSLFKVNLSGELQSKGTSTGGIISLHTSSNRLLNTEWNFFVRLGFNPSTTNYPKIFLASDQADLKGNLNGYFVKIGGETGNTDGIDLYRQSAASSVKIIDGISGRAGKSLNTLRIKVICSPFGKWEVYSDTTGGTNFLLEGSVIDTTFKSSSYFGITCNYTSTRKDLFYFDDILITEAPVSILKATAINDSVVEVSFSKTLNQVSVENALHYTVNSLNPVSVQYKFAKVELLLNQKLKNGQSYTLIVNNLADSAGNLIKDGSSISFTYKRSLVYGDLIISEIFCDPSPSEGLPSEEYIELFNRTSDTIDLKNFTFSDSSTIASLPEMQIFPYSYLIITSKDGESDLAIFGSVLGLNTFPSLNNSSDHIFLNDENGKLIFKVNYNNGWYQDPLKSEGGWSLEMVNLNEYCAGETNWKASVNIIGGTPGEVNSVNSFVSDAEGPALISGYFIDSLTADLIFNENLDTLSKNSISINCPLTISDFAFINEKILRIRFSYPVSSGNPIHLILHNLADCKENKTTEILFDLIMPSPSDGTEIILNEILFNPKTGGVDFVEIYNRSGKYISLKNWSIASLKDNNVYIKAGIAYNLIIPPYDYLAFTESPATLEKYYSVPYPNKIIELDLPSFNDDEGTVLIFKDSIALDRFDYKETYHFPLLDEKEGVSLERISPLMETNNPDNWYSSSASVGFATPGYENSQSRTLSPNKNFKVEPPVFSPDQDGHDDLAIISYHFDTNGNIGNIKIYDAKGRQVKSLVQNQLLSTEGFFHWDGTDNNGNLMALGYYIILLEVYNADGQVRNYKMPVVLGNRL